LIDACAVLAELSELNSELFVSALAKHSPKQLGFANIDDISLPLRYLLSDAEVSDKEDYYRMGNLLNKSMPVTLYSVATSGTCEDFFYSWNQEAAPTSFNAESGTDLLFDDM
jgi:hypothetical protein